MVEPVKQFFFFRILAFLETSKKLELFMLFFLKSKHVQLAYLQFFFFIKMFMGKKEMFTLPHEKIIHIFANFKVIHTLHFTLEERYPSR